MSDHSAEETEAEIMPSVEAVNGNPRELWINNLREDRQIDRLEWTPTPEEGSLTVALSRAQAQHLHDRLGEELSTWSE